MCAMAAAFVLSCFLMQGGARLRMAVVHASEPSGRGG
uniref:Uncharacterized protein n=1 Tax=Arundo donax TaxID=35708 RepID=A0A0A8YHR6_ARUDO